MEFQEDNNIQPDIEADFESESKAKRKTGNWFLLFLLFLMTGIVILYISNVIVVNNLLDDNQSLSKEYNSLINSNKMLEAKFTELQSSEDFIKFATDSLGLIQSEELPVIIEY